ncbi:hypothetical protein MD484_g1213, partial [Candolleomyces efflorescens]
MDASSVQPAEAEPTASQPPRSNRGPSSNLYLVTFLATLFLLLFVSCAIVLRSYFLRRRYQRQVAHALAQGIVLTPRAPGSRKKRFGSRPHMYESWIAPLHVSGVSGSQLLPQEKPQGGRWCDMLPLTVQTVVVKRRAKDPNAASPLSSPVVGNSPDPATSPLVLFPSADRTNVRFAETPTEPPPRNFLSRFLSPNANPAPSSTPFQQSRFGLLEMPHPNTTTSLPGRQQQETRSEDNVRERERERRESATWRAIVSPSPSLTHAFVGPPAEDPALAAANGNGQVRRPRPTITTTALNDSPNVVVSPTSAGPASALGVSGTKYRIRTEMLQISVMVAMPDIRMSTLYGDAGVVKRLRAAELGGWGYRGPKLEYSSDEEEEDGKKKTGKDVVGSQERSSRRKEKEKDEDEDEIVEVPGDESSSSDEDDDEEEEEEEEEEEHVPLPELVLGVLRLNYKHNSLSALSTPVERSPPTFVIPSNPPPPPPVPAPIPVPAPVFDMPPPIHREPREDEEQAAPSQAQPASGEGHEFVGELRIVPPSPEGQTKFNSNGLVQSSS